MTAVAVPVTGAAAPAGVARPAAPGFALWVGLPESQDPAALHTLAQAVLGLVGELAPGAPVLTAVALGEGGPRGELLSHVRSDLAAQTPQRPAVLTATERAEAVWRTAGVAVVLDPGARTLTIDGRPVALTLREFDLLEYLLRSPHRVVSREELLRTVWRAGVPCDGTRTIDVHVRRLREKLGSALQLVTVRGVGYRCDPTPETVLVGSGDAG